MTSWTAGKQNLSRFKGRGASVALIGSTHGELMDRWYKGADDMNVLADTNSAAYGPATYLNNVIHNLPPGYEAAFSMQRSVARQCFEVRLNMSMEGQAKATHMIELAYDMEDEFYQEKFDELVDTVYTTLNQAAFKQIGKYPNIRAWAVKHNMMTKLANDIPGFVFPKWNAAYPNTKALPQGGLTNMNGEVMAPQKRAVKVSQGAIPRREPKIPMCPKHDSRMALDTDENIWKCQEKDCKIIFRPKADDRPPGTVVLGKGEITIKTDGTGKLILVSDDNVCLDISKYIKDAKFDVDQDMPQVLNPGLGNVMAVPTNRRTRVTLDIEGMNIVVIK